LSENETTVVSAMLLKHVLRSVTIYWLWPLDSRYSMQFCRYLSVYVCPQIFAATNRRATGWRLA